MLVSNWLSNNATTVDVDDSMHDAMKRMKEMDIRMLPVLKKGKLVGVVTDRDIKGRTQLQSGADLHGGPPGEYERNF